MVEINYHKLDSQIEDLHKRINLDGKTDPASLPSVFLIYGEELLYKTAYNKLLEVLIPKSSRSLNYEPVDGSTGTVFEAIERVNTFSLLAGRKVVALLDIGLFDAKKDAAPLLKKCRRAYDDGKMSSAANHLLRMMALLNISFEELTASGLKKHVSNITSLLEDPNWLAAVADYCRQNGRDVPPAADSESALLRAIDNGFPPGNCLIVTTDTIDKRRKVYKTISKIGVVIDCSVPKGSRKVDKDSQTAVMKEIADAILSENDKSLAPGAFKLLCEVTGFNLRTFCGNLEKLISYIGDREQITQNDIQSVLKRTKKDPVYAFTNAIAERNIGDSLFYMNSLMTEATGSMQPEQILVAILNQVRKLLRVKEFCTTDAGRAWFPGCPYGQFKASVMPAVMEFDKTLIQELGIWQQHIAAIKQPQKRGAGGRSRKKKTKQKTDLSLVKSANNPYPVFQTFQKADRFSEKELIDAFEHLSRADMRIKTGSENKKLVLEELVFNICSAS